MNDNKRRSFITSVAGLASLDRKIASAFGTLVLVMMLIVLIVVGFYFQRILSEDEDKLTTILTSVLSDSINRISFSGKYHARLLIKEVSQQHSQIAYCMVVDRRNKIIAHSNSALNDTVITDETMLRVNQIYEGKDRVIHDLTVNGEQVKEVAMPYHTGYTNELTGVIVVGISTQGRVNAVRRCWLSIAGLTITFLIFAVFIIYRMSSHFARPVRQLALKFQGVLDHAPSLIAIYTPDGSIQEASDSFLNIFFPGEDLKGKNIEQITLEVDPGSIHTVGSKLGSVTEIVHQNVELPGTNGAHFFIVARFPIVVDNKGTPQFICFMAQDITERKQTKKKLEQLLLAIEQVAETVVITNVQATIQYVNPAFERLTGYTSNEALGQNPRILKSGEQDASFYQEMWDTLGRGETWRGRLTNKKKNGMFFTEEVTISPVRDASGEIVNYVAVKRDVTEEIKLEEELLKGRKLESVGVLAGGIAHDFNNILAAILGNISLALTTVDPKDEIYELLIESEKASLRAKDLTQQLLTFAKGGEPVKKIAAIDEIIKDSAGFVLRGSNVRCDFKFGEKLWPVAIDTGQISQVIQNIVINASQAMPTGGTIAIDCLNYCLEPNDLIPVRSGNYIKIVIKDQGVGIPADMLDKIFDPYFTSKQKGSGLGLAISHSIISKHDGHITVDSKQGQGTTFTIYLPASQDRQELGQKAVVVPPVAGQGRVMIMDDEEMIRSLVEKALSRIGYEVISAESGNEAIQLYQKAKDANAPIDLIIMDLTIPGGMGGKEAIKEIHKIDPEAKVIVSSGYSTDPVMADFSEYGFCGAMAKPFQIRELMEIVGKAVSS